MTLLAGDLSRLALRLLKFAGIAVVAGIAAWLTLLAMVRLESPTSEPAPLRSLFSAIQGSLVVGLPVAWLTFQWAGRHIAAAPSTLGLIAGLAAVMLVLASFAIGDANAAYWLGLPSVAAVATYAGLGWLWIIRPEREKSSA
ncbi:MAG: hypothetical protein AAF650_02030 [Pseudomonadota bacterium]